MLRSFHDQPFQEHVSHQNEQPVDVSNLRSTKPKSEGFFKTAFKRLSLPFDFNMKVSSFKATLSSTDHTLHKVKNFILSANPFQSDAMKRAHTFLKDPTGLAKLYEEKGFTFEEAKTILTAQNDKGETSLHHPTLFKRAIPLLQKLSPAERQELLLVQDDKGRTPLGRSSIYHLVEMHYPTLLEEINQTSFVTETAISHLPKEAVPETEPTLPEQELQPWSKPASHSGAIKLNQHIGSMRVPAPETEAKIEHLQVTKELIPEPAPLKKEKMSELELDFIRQDLANACKELKNKSLSFDDFAEALTSADANGNIPLHNPEVFQKAFEQLKGDQDLLTRFLALTNETGTPFLEVHGGGYQVLASALVDGDWTSTKVKQILPLLKCLSSQDQVRFFSQLKGMPQFKNPIIHNPLIFEAILPFLKELPFSNQQALLSITSHRLTALQKPDIFEKMWPYLQSLPIEQQMALLKIKGLDDTTPLHVLSNFKIAGDFLMTLPAERRFELMSLCGDRGETPLHDIDLFTISGSLLSDFTSQQLRTLFSIQTKEGKTILHELFTTNYPDFQNALAILQQMSRDDLLASLSIQDKRGRTPLTINSDVRKMEAFLANFTQNEQVSLLTQSDKKGTTPLSLFFNPFTPLEEKWQFLSKFSNEQIEQMMLSTRNSKGNTLLHKPRGRFLIPLLEQRGIDTSQWVNNLGLTPSHLAQYNLNKSWIVKPKMGLNEGAKITREEYDKQLTQLADDLDELWGTIEFGEGEGKVDSHILEISDSDGIVQKTPGQISMALAEMLALMKDQTAWLGTPAEGDVEGLHRFYSAQLFNMQGLVSSLKEKNNPQETAGYLVSVATPRFEGRCAAAYQSEISQKAKLAAGKSQDLNSIVEEAAANSLLAIVENLVRRDYYGDVHYMTHFMHAAGLAAEPDPLLLKNMSVDYAQGVLIDACNLSNVFTGFSQEMSLEVGISWLKMKTPEDALPEYVEMRTKLEGQERELADTTQQALQGILSEDQAQAAMQYIRTTQGQKISLPENYSGAEGELIQSIAQQEWRPNPTLPPLDLKESLPKGEEAVKNAFKEYLNVVPAQTKRLVEFQLENKQKDVLAQMKRVAAFEAWAQEQQLTNEQKQAVLQTRTQYSQGIAKIAEQVEDDDAISYSPFDSRLPSQAVEEARQLKYNEPHIEQRPQMLMRMLEVMGAVQTKDQKA